MDEKRIFSFLGDWIKDIEEGNFDTFKKRKKLFGIIEQETFGDVSQRIRNSTAMQYDQIRNMIIVYYSIEKKEFNVQDISSYDILKDIKKHYSCLKKQYNQ